MSGLAGDILFPVLVITHLLWDWKHGGFRGIVVQILGALCVGTILNAIVNLRGYDADRVVTMIVIYGILAFLFYRWAWARRHRNLMD